jgi:hypothetical protein
MVLNRLHTKRIVRLWFQSRVFLWKQGGFVACSRGQRPRAPHPQPPGALTAPWWQVKPPLAPGGLRGMHCLRAPISQCPGTTGYNENKALPFPRHGNAPARRGASRVWPPKWGVLVLGSCFTPTPSRPWHRPRRLKQIDPPQCPRVQYHYAPPG